MYTYIIYVNISYIAACIYIYDAVYGRFWLIIQMCSHYVNILSYHLQVTIIRYIFHDDNTEWVTFKQYGKGYNL